MVEVLLGHLNFPALLLGPLLGPAEVKLESYHETGSRMGSDGHCNGAVG